jgi:hypothetical protein
MSLDSFTDAVTELLRSTELTVGRKAYPRRAGKCGVPLPANKRTVRVCDPHTGETYQLTFEEVD